MGAIPPNEEEKKFWNDLNHHNVIEHIDPDKLELDRGFVFARCGDADHFRPHLNLLLPLLGQKSGDRVHTITLNGGAIREAMVEETVESLVLKGIMTAVLSIHVPCGKLRAEGISPEQAMNKMFENKRAIKERSPDSKVLCVVYFYDGTERQVMMVQGKRWRRHSTQQMAAVPLAAKPVTHPQEIGA